MLGCLGRGLPGRRSNGPLSWGSNLTLSPPQGSFYSISLFPMSAQKWTLRQHVGVSILSGGSMLTSGWIKERDEEDEQ